MFYFISYGENPTFSHKWKIATNSHPETFRKVSKNSLGKTGDGVLLSKVVGHYLKDSAVGGFGTRTLRDLFPSAASFL